MTEYRASRTAVVVCQGRAVADGRIAPGRFSDPTAMPLLRPEEREVVGLVRAGTPPEGMAARLAYEMVRAAAEAIVPRTVAIDDAVRAHPTPQLVILGAGLDGRAWRLPAPAVFEVDQPASQADKRDRAEALPAERAPHFVPVDFGRDDLGAALRAAGHDATVPTTWIWEGVVPYLTPAQVTSTVAGVAACSAPGSRLIVNYQAPSVRGDLARRFMGLLLRAARQTSPWTREPWRSTWSAPAMAALLAGPGFAVGEDRDLLSVALDLGLTPARGASLPTSRVAVADRR